MHMLHRMACIHVCLCACVWVHGNLLDAKINKLSLNNKLTCHCICELDREIANEWMIGVADTVQMQGCLFQVISIQSFIHSFCVTKREQEWKQEEERKRKIANVWQKNKKQNKQKWSATTITNNAHILLIIENASYLWLIIILHFPSVSLFGLSLSLYFCR